MGKFNEFFLMNTEDVKQYAVEILKKFEPDEELESVEIGDGNINYVFRVRSKKDGRSVVVKQADKLLRSSGRPLDTYRNKIEARILQMEGELAPAYVPEVYFYDEIMSALSMEDISAYGNLRKELMANRVYPHLSGNLSSFLADTLLPTTDLVLPSAQKKEKAKFFVNPELCDITEDLVLSEPYMAVPYNERNRNILFPGNEAFVEKYLYEDEQLHSEVAVLRDRFMNCAQALIHGDLHPGSIFANEDGLKVIDPEFAFYGPMGYDIGNVIGNFFFAWANKVFTMPEERETIAAIEKTIAETFDKTFDKISKKYDALVSFPLYRTAGFKKYYLDGVMSDTLGYAGTEIIRRVVGDSKVIEVTSVKDPALRVPMERALIRLGIALIKQRDTLRSGAQVTDTFRHILELDKKR